MEPRHPELYFTRNDQQKHVAGDIPEYGDSPQRGRRPAASRSTGPARFAMNHIASAKGMAGDAIDRNPPAIGNNPARARIAATTSRTEKVADDLGSISLDMSLLSRTMLVAVAVAEVVLRQKPLFSVFVGPNPVFSTPSSLFFAKQGGRGITMLPKSLSVSNSHYLQFSQQNTNSLHFFAMSTLCFHHVLNSFAQKPPR